MNRNTTNISRGFTLIELLVVIAIIALLLAILGPSLGVAMDRVEEAICRSNLKQWALMYSLYANDNDDSFPQSIAGGSVDWNEAWVIGALQPYYADLNLRDCRSTKSSNRLPGLTNYGETFMKWGPFPKTPGSSWDNYAYGRAEGSYGYNNWVADPPPSAVTFWGLAASNAVRTIYEKGASRIPMMCDSIWWDLAPEMKDVAPENDEHETDSYNAKWNTDSLKWTCIDRHKGGINMVFVDMDARHVGVKELWYLRWHKEWVRCLPTNAWPTWTDKYRDY